MEQLPVELRRAIISHIDVPTLKKLRLTSKAWAELGEEYLISPTFTTFPHRPDTFRLLALADHPKFSYRIQEIDFNHGEVNEYHARHNTYFMLYTRDPEARIEEMASCWNSYALIREQKDQFLPNSCNRECLTHIFRQLPNLRTIRISLMANPFQEDHPELLQDLWSVPSTRHLPRVATTERCTNILAALAANSSTISIKNLFHDRLPFEFFAQKESTMSLFAPVLECLTTLDLAIDYSDMPNNLHAAGAFENLATLLRAASSLQTLSLAFQGRRKVDILPLLTSFINHNYIFDVLKHLTLKGIIATEIGLGDFLVRQKNSLKRVHLGGVGVRGKHQPPNGGVHLSTGTFRGLFTRIRSDMKLESLRVQGDMIGLESHERWILEYATDEGSLWEFVMD